MASVGERDGLFETAIPPACVAPASLATGPIPLARDGPLAGGGISPLEPPMFVGMFCCKGVTFTGGRPPVGIGWFWKAGSGSCVGGIPCRF